MARPTKEEKERKKAEELRQIEELRKKKKVKDEIIAVLIIALGLFLIISMFTSTTGAVGATIKTFLAGLLGWVSYILPFFLVIYGVLVFAQKTSLVTGRSIIASILLFVLLTCFVANFKIPLKDVVKYDFSYSIKDIFAMGTDSGGIVGVYAGGFLKNLIGEMGLYLVSIAGVLIASLLIFNTPISVLFDNAKMRRKARKAEREAARLEREELDALARERSEEVAKLEEQARSERIAKQNELADNGQQKLDVDKIPKLNMSAMDDFDGHVAKVEPQSEPEPTHFTPEDIGLKTPEKQPVVFEGDNISENQHKVLETWIEEDFTNGMGTTHPGTGLEPATAAVASVAAASTPRKRTSSASSEKKTETSSSVAPEIEVPKPAKEGDYAYPPINLLNASSGLKNESNNVSLADQAKLLENTLASFGVSASVIDVIQGPAVTRFEVQPATGVKVSKIAALHDDLALNLRAKSLRIEAPIPGKAAVGIEVSNNSISTVTLREIIESKEFAGSKSKISVALGRSIGGDSIVANLKEMPHLLVAGSTGSGKSVCINSMLISLLYKATPEEVKLILIDPKVVELSVYNGIPHLLIPVVTDPAKASAALGWAVSEMDRRYKAFADQEVRDLESYNEKMRADGEVDEILPQIVIVIDELAELIMTAKNTVEDSICRIAQKARAAGMHLIVATQRPSTDVITGVIKANIPSRIAFAVSSQTDSRVILDVGGAEHLLGKGDMLYGPQSLNKPLRVQGCFVSDSEVRDVINYVKQQVEMANYNEDIIHAMNTAGINNAAGAPEDSGEDEILKDAIETVVRAEQCSTSMLQRRFRIGYNRAARLVDLMEERGIVGPADGSRPRKVNMTLAEFQSLENQALATEEYTENDEDDGVPDLID